MDSLGNLFANNQRWSEKMRGRDPQFFEKLINIQQPEFLWIGCADSRVPANQIVGLAPGEMFVHRNLANQVDPTDPNGMGVAEFAIHILRVKHVIVCGHYGCSGVRTALDGRAEGFVGEWLEPLQEMAATYSDDLAKIATFDEQWARLCELNVIAQVQKLSQSNVVRSAWDAGLDVTLHGWIYSLKDGLLRDLNVTATAALP